MDRKECTILEESSPLVFYMSTHLANESLTAFCSELSLEEFLYSQ